MTKFSLTDTGVLIDGRTILSINRGAAGIRVVSSNADYLSDEAAAHAEALIREARANARIERQGDSQGDALDLGGLTPREAEVLRFLSSGFSNKEVARRLALSVRTVETHRRNLRRKTQTGRLKDLVCLARSLNLQPVEA